MTEFQDLGFVSNALNDFDGDGCKDGVEDSDDDGDGTLNHEDSCPNTVAGEVDEVDSFGCSNKQNKRNDELVRRQREGVLELGDSRPSSSPEAEGSGNTVETEWNKWRAFLLDCALQVVFGGLFTAVLGYMWETGSCFVKDQAGKNPAASRCRMSINSSGVAKEGVSMKCIVRRSLIYFMIFCAVYGSLVYWLIRRRLTQ